MTFSTTKNFQCAALCKSRVEVPLCGKKAIDQWPSCDAFTIVGNSCQLGKYHGIYEEETGEESISIWLNEEVMKEKKPVEGVYLIMRQNP